MTIEEHAEFIDFSVIGLPKYEAILGKPWLSRWNPVIDWKKNSLTWKMGSRVIRVKGLQEPHSSGIVSSLFQRKRNSGINFSTTNEKTGQERASICSNGQNNE